MTAATLLHDILLTPQTHLASIARHCKEERESRAPLSSHAFLGCTDREEKAACVLPPLLTFLRKGHMQSYFINWINFANELRSSLTADGCTFLNCSALEAVFHLPMVTEWCSLAKLALGYHH